MSEIFELPDESFVSSYEDKQAVQLMEPKLSLTEELHNQSDLHEEGNDQEKDKENGIKEFVKKTAKKTKWVPYQADVSVISDKSCLKETLNKMADQKDKDRFCQQRKDRTFQRRKGRYFSNRSRNSKSYKYQHSRRASTDNNQEENYMDQDFDQSTLEYIGDDSSEKKPFGLINSENHQNPFLLRETNQHTLNSHNGNHPYIQPISYPYIPSALPYSSWIPSYQMMPYANIISPSLQPFIPDSGLQRAYTSAQPSSNGSIETSSLLKTPTGEENEAITKNKQNYTPPLPQQQQQQQQQQQWVYFNPQFAPPQEITDPNSFNPSNTVINPYALAFPSVCATNAMYSPYTAYMPYYPPPNGREIAGFTQGQTLAKTEHQQLLEKLKVQLRYYFSTDNLCRDAYLRKHMDKEGFVSLQFIFSFSMINSVAKNDYTNLVEAANDLDTLEMKSVNNDSKVRLRNGWEKWVSD